MTVALLALSILLPSNVVNTTATHHRHPDRRLAIVRPYNSKLERMAMCESTKRWFLNTGNGYFGGLQFTASTWWSVGGRGYPHQNSRLEQKYRAVKVFKRRGNWADWPVCGYA